LFNTLLKANAYTVYLYDQMTSNQYALWLLKYIGAFMLQLL